MLASEGAIAHENGRSFAYPYSDWQMRKQLGFADVQGHAARWLEELPAGVKYRWIFKRGHRTAVPSPCERDPTRKRER